MNKTKIIAVVGATASGKSALALELAKRYNGEIISCDSMQVYKRMDIGTAKPTQSEMLEVKHHMIDIVEPDTDFSCADYVTLASRAIEECADRGKLPIVCGGTGLYLDSLLRGGDFAPCEANEELRRELERLAESEGKEALHERLRAVDPESAEAIHPNNVKRVIRALEIYMLCGVTKSELDRRSRIPDSRYDATVGALVYENRDILYSRIEKRVDAMIADGLCEETLSLMREGVFEKNRTAAQAIGYKEIIGYCKGEESLDACRDRLVLATRHYAKRQITWFGSKDYVKPIAADGAKAIKTFEEIVNNAAKLFSL